MSTDIGTNPNTAFSNEASKDERLEALRNDRAQHQPRPAGGPNIPEQGRCRCWQ